MTNRFTARVHWGFSDDDDEPALYVDKGDRPPGAKTQISAPAAREAVKAFVATNRERVTTTSLAGHPPETRRGVSAEYARISIENARYIVLVLRDKVHEDGDDAIVFPMKKKKVIAAVGALTDWTQTWETNGKEYPYCEKDELYVDLLCSAKASTTANKGAATVAVAKMEAFAASLAKRALVTNGVTGSEKFWVGTCGFVECEPIINGVMDDYINGIKIQCKRRVHEENTIFISKALPACAVPISAKAAVAFWTGKSIRGKKKRPGITCAQRAKWNPPKGAGHSISGSLSARTKLSDYRSITTKGVGV